MTYSMAREALKIRKKSKTFINMIHSLDHIPDDLCAIAAYYMGMLDKARERGSRALLYSPGNKRLQKNLKMINAK